MLSLGRIIMLPHAPEHLVINNQYYPIAYVTCSVWKNAAVPGKSISHSHLVS